jgi:20S proteasome alpha/beta subunit
VYAFDPVGSYERLQCRAGGAAASLIMPFLDNQVYFYAVRVFMMRWILRISTCRLGAPIH